MSGEPAGGSGLVLTSEEAGAVAAAASGYAAVLPPAHAVPYRALAEAAEDGRITDDLTGAAERVISVSLQTGRARRDGQADEKLLAAVYRRTPAGKALAGRAREINQALQTLTGRELKTARVGAPAPGSYTLTLEADGVAVTLEIGTSGIEIRSLQAG